MTQSDCHVVNIKRSIATSLIPRSHLVGMVQRPGDGAEKLSPNTIYFSQFEQPDAGFHCQGRLMSRQPHCMFAGWPDSVVILRPHETKPSLMAVLLACFKQVNLPTRPCQYRWDCMLT